MKSLLMAIMAVLFFSTRADAESMRMNQLAEICNWHTAYRATGSQNGEARCQARVLGEVDGVEQGMRLTHGDRWFCMPKAASWEEKFEVVQRYVLNHPEAMSAPVGDVVSAALADAYPCRHK